MLVEKKIIFTKDNVDDLMGTTQVNLMSSNVIGAIIKAEFANFPHLVINNWYIEDASSFFLEKYKLTIVINSLFSPN